MPDHWEFPWIEFTLDKIKGIDVTTVLNDSSDVNTPDSSI